MTLHVYTNAMKHRQPGVAKRGVFWCDDVVTELDTGTTAGEQRGAVVEVVLRADITSVGEGNMIE